jgi:hypothetical protein
MPHEIYASFGSFLFLFKMFLESHLLDAIVVIDDEWIHVSLIFSVLAHQIITAHETGP